ncbi:MAG: Phage capsid family protein [Syntrophorhabdus sp. PtaU1.Bin050]|nr:MAG: Phage capsid family protein [Syntrophorhabdus sp. PtaU1.Bin050]
MLKKEMELRQDKADTLKRMKTLLDTAEDGGRSLTTAEKKEYERLDSRVTELNAQLQGFSEDTQRRANLSRQMTDLEKVVNPLPSGARDSFASEDDGGFRNIGEFFRSIAVLKSDGRMDERLLQCAEQREQTMGTGQTGGFALPKQFDSTIRQVTPQEAIVRPRGTVISPGNPPDAQLSFPALDQTAAQNMYGGVIITHTGEGVTMTEATANLREVTLEPKEMSAYIVVTQKLLNNWEASGTWISGILRQAMNGQEDYDFLRGDGINKALGVMNCAAAIQYSRTAANAISFTDCVGMLSRILMKGPLCWVGSQSIIPQLAAMVDSGGHAVWLGGGNLGQAPAAQAMPSTLLGVPLIFSDRLPGLGTKGDLCLLSPMHYMIKDGSGPIAASSEHIYFLSNKVVFKLVWNVDGRPWLTEPLPLEGSTINTVSPFVILN